MARKFKILGLAFVAVIATSAGTTTMAQATSGALGTFPGGASVIVTAEQVGEHEVVLTDHPVSGGFFNWRCKKVTFTGTEAIGEGATTISIHPTYSECTIGGSPATITTTGCKYLLHLGTPTMSSGWHVTTDVVCTAGATIKIVAGTCELSIGAQNGIATSEATNSGGAETGMDLLLHTKLTNLQYTVTKDNIGCFLSGTGTFNKGDYSGTTTVKAHNAASGQPVGLTVGGSGPPPSLTVTGDQVGENVLSLTDHPVEGGFASAKCSIARVSAPEPVEEVEDELRLHPEFSQCTAFGQPATIFTTNCDYVLQIGSPTAGGWHVTKDVVCSGGSVIRIVTGTCEVTIGAQNGLTTSEVTNSGSSGTAMDLLLHTNINGVHYTVVKDNIGCPLSGKGSFSKGDYVGTTTVKAHNSVSGITVTKPSPDLLVTGDQVGENALQFTDHLISGQPASVKCSTAKITGTKAVKAVEGELQVHPVLEGCIAFGSAATVTTTNCDYLLNIGTPTEGGWHVTTDVVCTGGAAIKIVAGNCEVTIGSQVGLTTSEIENSGTAEAMDILFHTSIAGIHYTVAKDGSGCALSGTGNFSQGDYTGTTTVKAHDAATLDPVGITKS